MRTDKWNSLSIKDKANLMKVYVNNGIKDLTSIKRHYNKFGDGGEQDKISSIKNTIQNREDFKKEIKAFYTDNPQKQKVVDIALDREIGLNEGQYAKKELMDWYTQRAKSKPDLVSEEQLKDLDYLLNTTGVVNASKVLKGGMSPLVPKDLREDYIETYKYVPYKQAKYLKDNPETGAVYSQDSHIVVNNDLPNNNINQDYPVNTILLHELMHGAPIFVPQIESVMEKHGIKEDEYTNKAEELYNRLVQLRSHYKINPNKNYTLEEIRTLREGKNEQSTGLDIFNNDLYSDDFILDLFNSVALNNDKNNYSTVNYNPVNFASRGGKINRFNEEDEKNTLGVPYRSLHSSEYDYFNASLDNMPKSKDEHWTSRNKEGRILKSNNHPTLDVALNVEGLLGNKIYKNVDGTYSSYEEGQFPTSLGVRINNKRDISPLDPNKKFKDIKTTKGRKYNENNMMYISDMLNNTLLSNVQKNAILGSIIEESGGNPFAVDETGRFKGLLQWEDSRYSPDNKLSEKEELDNQLLYLMETLYNTNDKKSWTHGGKGSGYKSGKHAKETFFDTDDLFTATHALNRGYIRPTGGDYSVKNRYNVAKQLK